MSVFTVAVSALEYLEGDGDGKARNYLLSIQMFHFVIILVPMEHVLESVLRSQTTFLLCDFVENQRKQRQRHSRFNRASRAGKQRHRGNVPADTPCQ